MNRAAAAVVLMAACCLAGARARAAASDEPAVSAAVSPEKLTVGDVLRYTLRIAAAPGVQVQVPAAAGNLGNFTVRSFDVKEQRKGASAETVVRYELSAFQTGNVTIPAVGLEFKAAGASRWQKLQVPERRVEVLSVLGSDPEAARLRDIEEPVAAHPYRGLLVAAAALLAAALGWALFQSRRRGMPAPLPRSAPAHVTALKELEELQCRMLIAQGLLKEYFSILSDIVRRYIENRFELRAPDMTTEEFLESIRLSDILSTEHAVLLREFLTCCDLVKFAKYRPEEKETDAAYAAAHNFVVQTKKEELPPETNPGGRR